jgi:hypothetical protein
VWYMEGSRTKEGTGAGIHSVRPKTDIKMSLGRHANISSRGLCHNLLSAREYKEVLSQ